mmetsp:Transcript_31089/g.39999  ORF Transcript_31089/g.39999 Transcript_31089/m.39999 type:complete len:272 (+) Transcript_31089:77-892(+)
MVSRPDCSFAVSVLSRYSNAPGAPHLKAALDLVKYLYHTRHWCIQYRRSESGGNDPKVMESAWHPSNDDITHSPDSAAVPDVDSKDVLSRSIEERIVASKPVDVPNAPTTYIDADLGGDRETRKSTSGLVIMMNGGPIAWSSRLQKLCAQSSAEAEISAVVDGVKEALHIRLLCEECGLRKPNVPMTVWEDNQACIQMGHNLRGSMAAKHYQLRLRFLNEHVWENNIEFAKIDTKDQLSDGFTKALPIQPFREFRGNMMVNPKDPSSVTIS